MDVEVQSDSLEPLPPAYLGARIVATHRRSSVAAPRGTAGLALNHATTKSCGHDPDSFVEAGLDRLGIHVPDRDG